MIRLRTPDGETRVYLSEGHLHTVNLTPTAATHLQHTLGFVPEASQRFLALPRHPRRTTLGFVQDPNAPLERLSTRALRELHDSSPTADGVPLLAVKREIARRLATPCTLCHHACNADRSQGEGWCRAPLAPSEAELVLHAGEEVQGVTLCVYLGPGCSHGCRFCTMHDLIHATPRQPLAATEVARHVTAARARGASSLTLIGGEPGIFLPWVLELLQAETTLPAVWNSNMYHPPDVARLLSGVVDVCVADMKFGNDACARKLARVSNYVEPVLASIASARRDAVPMVVRHVVMPNHLGCCTEPVLTALAAAVPDVPVHLSAFIPEHRSAEVGLTDFTSDVDLERAQKLANELGVDLW